MRFRRLAASRNTCSLIRFHTVEAGRTGYKEIMLGINKIGNRLGLFCKPYPVRRRLAAILDPFQSDPAIGTCLLLPSHGGLRSSRRGRLCARRVDFWPRDARRTKLGVPMGRDKTRRVSGSRHPRSGWCWRCSPPRLHRRRHRRHPLRGRRARAPLVRDLPPPLI